MQKGVALRSAVFFTILKNGGILNKPSSGSELIPRTPLLSMKRRENDEKTEKCGTDEATKPDEKRDGRSQQHQLQDGRDRQHGQLWHDDHQAVCLFIGVLWSNAPRTSSRTV